MSQLYVMCDYLIVMPLGFKLIQTFKLTQNEFGNIIIARGLGSGLGALAGAFLVDTMNRKKLLLVTIPGMICCTCACALAPTYILFLVGRCCGGLFSGVLYTLNYTTAVSETHRSERARAIGLLNSSGQLASAIILPFGVFLITFDWRLPILAVAALGTMGWVIALFMPKPMAYLEPAPLKTTLRKLQAIAFEKRYHSALGSHILAVLSGSILIPYFSTFLVYNVGLKPSFLTLYYLVGGVCAALVGLSIGTVSDRFGSKKALWFAILFSVMPIYFLTSHQGKDMFAPLVFFTLVVVGNSWRQIASTAALSENVSSKMRSSLLSVSLMMQNLGFAVGGLIANCVITLGNDGSLQQFSTLGLISMCLCLGAGFCVLKNKPVRELEQSEIDSLVSSLVD